MEGRHAWCGRVASVISTFTAPSFIEKTKSCLKGILMIPAGKYLSSYDWSIMNVPIRE